MELKNISSYPVTVKGTTINQGETKEVEIDDIEYYENHRRFSLEEDDKSESEQDEDNSDDEVISKSKEQKTNKKGD